MPAYNVIIQPEAEHDLDEAYAWLETQHSGLGFQFLANLTETIELLEENPFLFQKVYGEKRRAVVQRFGYNLIYKVVDKEVYILAIMHGSRDPEQWQVRR
jgi:plasmid stabilization system protein ParE